MFWFVPFLHSAPFQLNIQFSISSYGTQLTSTFLSFSLQPTLVTDHLPPWLLPCFLHFHFLPLLNFWKRIISKGCFSKTKQSKTRILHWFPTAFRKKFKLFRLLPEASWSRPHASPHFSLTSCSSRPTLSVVYFSRLPAPLGQSPCPGDPSHHLCPVQIYPSFQTQSKWDLAASFSRESLLTNSRWEVKTETHRLGWAFT